MMGKKERVAVTYLSSAPWHSLSERQHEVRGQEGFLYVEVLVAVLILALALVGTTPLFILAVKENTASSDLTFATTAAQDKAETLKADDFASLSNGTDTVTLHGTTFDRAWTVQNDVPHPGMKTITVTVATNRESTFGNSGQAVVRFYRVP